MTATPTIHEALIDTIRLADSMGFGRTHDALRVVIAALSAPQFRMERTDFSNFTAGPVHVYPHDFEFPKDVETSIGPSQVLTNEDAVITEVGHRNPPADSKPVADLQKHVAKVWIALQALATAEHTERNRKLITDAIEDLDPVVGGLVDLAHPPADSLDTAIGELPEGWLVFRLRDCHPFGWSCILQGPDLQFVEGTGPSPLAALRDAMDKVGK